MRHQQPFASLFTSSSSPQVTCADWRIEESVWELLKKARAKKMAHSGNLSQGRVEGAGGNASGDPHDKEADPAGDQHRQNVPGNLDITIWIEILLVLEEGEVQTLRDPPQWFREPR